MSAWEIATIVLAVTTIITTANLARVWSKGRNLVKGVLAIRQEVKKALEDGRITDEEKKQIGDIAIKIILEMTDIFQALANLSLAITRVVRRR